MAIKTSDQEVGVGGGIRGVLPRRAHSDSREHQVEELVPSSAWDEDSLSHFLLIDLPGFKKEEVTLQVEMGEKRIRVSGERLVNHNKYLYFHQTYQLPPGISDTDKITGKFDGEILYVTVPKQTEPTTPTPEPAPASNNNNNNSSSGNNEVAEFGKGELEKWECFGEASVSASASVMWKAISEEMRKHKGIVTVAVLAFALGLWMSPKFNFNQPPPPPPMDK